MDEKSEWESLKDWVVACRKECLEHATECGRTGRYSEAVSDKARADGYLSVELAMNEREENFKEDG